MPSKRQNKIVLAWSGEASSKVALALCRFLKLTLHGCEPWVSSEHVAAGAFWHNELLTALKSARIGILCLTAGNVESKWIHFEAGAIANSFGSPNACPYLLNVDRSQLQGPLQHLQCVTADEQGTFRLVREINGSLSAGRLEQDLLHASFSAHWPALSGTLNVIAEEEKALSETRSPTDDGQVTRIAQRLESGSDGVPRSAVSAEEFLARFGLQQLAQRFLKPADHSESPLDFALYRYSNEALNALLGATRDLQSFIGQEIATRSRRLLQESSDSSEGIASEGIIQTATPGQMSRLSDRVSSRGIIDIAPAGPGGQ